MTDQAQNKLKWGDLQGKYQGSFVDLPDLPCSGGFWEILSIVYTSWIFFGNRIFWLREESFQLRQKLKTFSSLVSPKERVSLWKNFKLFEQRIVFKIQVLLAMKVKVYFNLTQIPFQRQKVVSIQVSKIFSEN